MALWILMHFSLPHPKKYHRVAEQGTVPGPCQGRTRDVPGPYQDRARAVPSSQNLGSVSSKT